MKALSSTASGAWFPFGFKLSVNGAISVPLGDVEAEFAVRGSVAVCIDAVGDQRDLAVVEGQAVAVVLAVGDLGYRTSARVSRRPWSASRRP